ncbi:MAG TPA: TerB family tellurite resistance protein [Gemmataceae bacterium]|nr:TerB family tellurite resistance protein [Gemmataceae bacterium]
MKVAVILFFVGVAASGLITFVVYYLRYSSSPAAQWKRRVRAAVDEEQRRHDAARRTLVEAKRDPEDEHLRQEFLDRHLRSIAVEELARYPGIGPGTVSRLRDAGLATVAACNRVRLSSVPGIGRSREADLRDALRKVRREAESRFDAGACREAVAFTDEKKRRQAERVHHRQEAEAAIHSSEASLVALADRVKIADGVTFLGHLFGHDVPGLTQELLDAPLQQPESIKLTPIPVGKLVPDRGPRPANPLEQPAPKSQPLSPGFAGQRGRGEGEGLASPESSLTSSEAPHPSPLPAKPGRGSPTPASMGLPTWVAEAPSIRPHADSNLPNRPVRVEVAAAPSASARPAAVPAPPPTPPPVVAPAKPAVDEAMLTLRAVVGLGLTVAKADGRIAASERKQVRTFVERKYAAGRFLSERLDAIIAEIEGDLPTLGDALHEVKLRVPVSAWPELYQFAESIADSAGTRNTREIECLARVAEELGIRVEPVAVPTPAPVVAAPNAPLTEADCRAALEIATDTPLNVELIRRQYYLLCDRFAPERFAAAGSDFVKIATEKRDRAERAARHLLAGYNEPLEPPAAPPPPADLRHNPDLDDVFGA